MRFLLIAFITIVLVSCKNEGVKTEGEKDDLVSSEKIDTLEMKKEILESKQFDNGMTISWLEHGGGENLKSGDVVMIDYKVRLKDSTIIDGNHLLNMEAMPFIIGFNMQTEGWDFALKNLKVGDFARIKIPSKLARGEKGIEGLVPPNADNYLAIRILSKKTPTRNADGNKVWVFEENTKNKLKFNENTKIVFHAMASSPSSPMYFNSYRTNDPFELRLEDNGVVPGLKKALINAKKGDRMFVLVKSEDAYSSKGYMDIVKPNEDLFFNILVMDVLD